MAKSALLAKMIKGSGNKDGAYASALSESEFFGRYNLASTDCIGMNLALSGDPFGGISPGITQFIGDSRTFKTNMCLFNIAAYMKKYKDAILLYFDCEGGAAMENFEMMGIDMDRVVHIMFEDIEELKQELTQRLNMIEKGGSDKVIGFIDSISQVASRKEAENAEEGNEAQDMTRARAMNSLFRIITPKLIMRKIPLFVINSFYTAIIGPDKSPITKGGKQQQLSSNTQIFITRRAIKTENKKDLLGWEFIMKVIKSRDVKENAIIPITVKYDGGLDIYSGLFEMAKYIGYITMPKNGWYQIKGEEDKPMKQKGKFSGPESSVIWEPLLKNKDFVAALKGMYHLKAKPLDVDGDLAEEIELDEIKTSTTNDEIKKDKIKKAKAAGRSVVKTKTTKTKK